ncbi:hypothetical protein PRUPE_3G203400 [Prunus persica]|uniref:Pectate lyase superfamily protein domain-containing protein n=1 Tax=Prunus persica TaxID=3760 RepID=A0A251Q495_PRUPE|nr:hypothetical protein PRUPE_3G203400 [Prunus persica]
MIAKGNYLVGPVKFQGPCKAPVSVRVEGALQALVEPEKLKLEDGWVIFQNIDGVTVSGDGTFDGQGSIAPSQFSYVESLPSLLSSILLCWPRCCLSHILGVGFVIHFLLGASAFLVVVLVWWFQWVCCCYCADSHQVNDDYGASRFVGVGAHGGEYCPNGQCQAKILSKVKINNVRFKNIRGTAADPVVVKLACSKGIPRQNV